MQNLPLWLWRKCNWETVLHTRGNMVRSNIFDGWGNFQWNSRSVLTTYKQITFLTREHRFALIKITFLQLRIVRNIKIVQNLRNVNVVQKCQYGSKCQKSNVVKMSKCSNSTKCQKTKSKEKAKCSKCQHKEQNCQYSVEMSKWFQMSKMLKCQNRNYRNSM